MCCLRAPHVPPTRRAFAAHLPPMCRQRAAQVGGMGGAWAGGARGLRVGGALAPLRAFRCRCSVIGRAARLAGVLRPSGPGCPECGCATRPPRWRDAFLWHLPGGVGWGCFNVYVPPTLGEKQAFVVARSRRARGTAKNTPEAAGVGPPQQGCKRGACSVATNLGRRAICKLAPVRPLVSHPVMISWRDSAFASVGLARKTCSNPS